MESWIALQEYGSLQSTPNVFRLPDWNLMGEPKSGYSSNAQSQTYYTNKNSPFPPLP